MPTVSLAGITGITDGTILVANAGTTYTGAAMQGNANAAPGNTINQMRVYQDLSPCTWAPFSQSFGGVCAFNPLSSGMHTSYATATDNYNHTVTSAPIRFVVNPATATPPTVAITAPANGTSVNAPGPIVFTANAVPAGSNTISSVSYYQGTTLLGSATIAPYAFTWTNVSSGTYSIIAVGADNVGGRKLSVPVNLTVNPQPPGPPSAPTLVSAIPGTNSALLNFTAPANDGGAAITGYTATCTATGQPPATASGTANATTIAVADMAGGTAYGCTVSATNSLGTGPVSNSISVTPLMVPSVAITAPANGAVFLAPATIDLIASAGATTGTIAQVDFYQGTTLLGSASASPYKFTWTNVPPGSYTLTARATSSIGASGTSTPVIVSVDPVVLNFSGLADGATLYESDVVVTGTFAGVTPTGITINGVAARLGTTTFAAVVPLQPGANALTIVTTTASGSVTQTLHVTSVAPSVTLTNVVSGQTISDDTVTLTGTALAPPNSAVIVNGHRAPLASDGTFFVNNLPLTQGANTINITLSTPGGAGVPAAGATAPPGSAVARKSAVTRKVDNPPDLSLQLNRDGTAPFTLELDTAEGFAPLTVTATLTNRSGALYDQLTLDLDSNGTPELTEVGLPVPIPERIFQATYNTPGVYRLTLTLTRQNGQVVVYRATRNVLVRSANAYDSFFGSIYGALLGRLAAGSIDSAMSLVTAGAAERLGSIFTVLNANMAMIVEQTGTVIQTTFNNNIAELLVERPGSNGTAYYMIYMIRGDDGVWRIDSM